jgi:hypothetical protein
MTAASAAGVGRGGLLAVTAAAGAAGLWTGLRIAESVDFLAQQQMLPARSDRVKMTGADPPADGHVADVQLVGGLLNGQQVVLFHAAEHTATREHHNTLRGFTGSMETCIIGSQFTTLEAPWQAT